MSKESVGTWDDMDWRKEIMKNILDKSMKIIIKMFFTIVITFALCKLPAKIAEKIGYMESQKKHFEQKVEEED